MIRLVPSWAHHYNEFWAAIRTRNLWFIKMRYFIVLALLIFLFVGKFILDYQLTTSQTIAIYSIAIFIFVYNVVIHYSRSKVGCVPGKFNCLHLSLLQMILDLTSLLFLIYFTGGIDSPVYLFAIFQTIIGSLILPGYVVYIIAGLYLIVFISIIVLQNIDVLDSHFIIGFGLADHNHNMEYVIIFIVMYIAMILFSVYIANKITYRLYKREQQLRESLMTIQDMEEQKQKYIMGIVHEVKTPIAAMQSMTDLILKGFVGEVPEAVKVKINRINQRSGEALTLVNDVLFISRLKLMSLSSAEEIDVKDMIDNLLNRFEGDYNEKNIHVEVKTDSDKNIIQADKIFIELAFKNVISNAIKYTPNDGSILIELKTLDQDLFIEVSDSGMGIPENELDNIFKEFYRAKNVKKSNIEGSGLGLSLVKQIIERHFGMLAIKSPSKIGTTENPGTVVEIKLPINSPLTEIKGATIRE